MPLGCVRFCTLQADVKTNRTLQRLLTVFSCCLACLQGLGIRKYNLMRNGAVQRSIPPATVVGQPVSTAGLSEPGFLAGHGRYSWSTLGIHDAKSLVGEYLKSGLIHRYRKWLVVPCHYCRTIGIVYSYQFYICYYCLFFRKYISFNKGLCIAISSVVFLYISLFIFLSTFPAPVHSCTLGTAVTSFHFLRLGVPGYGERPRVMNL